MKLNGSCHCKAAQFTVESHTPYPYMRCYCSICRKTAGGGGFAVNIMGQAQTLKVVGKKNIRIYRATLIDEATGKSELSSSRRHFCMLCGSALWIADPNWPQWIYPYASAIDTDLPKPPEYVNIMLDFAASWAEIRGGKKQQHCKLYPEESIEHWHKRHKLYLK